MAVTKAVVNLAALDGVPENAVLNTFFFNDTGGGTDAQITDALDRFYNDVHAATAAIGDYISRSVNRAADACSIDLYTMPAVDGPTGSPRSTTTFTLEGTDAGNVTLPSECAAVLSFAADLAGIPEESGVTRPRARRRGRVFLGPLNSNATDATAGATTPLRLGTPFLEVCTAAADVELEPGSLGDWEWCVFSQTDWVARPVETIWMDNAFDTQRRRGVEATFRQNETL